MKLFIKNWFAQWDDSNSDANRKGLWIGFILSNVYQNLGSPKLFEFNKNMDI